MHSQACAKYPKQVYNIFAIKKQLNENVRDDVDLSPADKRQIFHQIDTIILGVFYLFISCLFKFGSKYIKFTILKLKSHSKGNWVY